MAERKIGDVTFRFEKLNPFEGIRLLGYITQTLGPAFPHIHGLIAGDEADRDAAMLRAFGVVATNLQVNEVVAFLKEITGYAQIQLNGNYEPVVPEVHLRTEMEIFRVATFVLESQFRDFFDGAKASPLGVAIRGSLRPSSAA